jgi:hypothetical protein
MQPWGSDITGLTNPSNARPQQRCESKSHKINDRRKMALDLPPSAFNSKQGHILFEESIAVVYLPHTSKYFTPKTMRGSFCGFPTPSRFVVGLLLRFGSRSFISDRFPSAHSLKLGHQEFEGGIGFSADSVAIVRLAAASAFRIVSESPGSDCWATSRAFLNQLVNDIPAKYIYQTSYFAWSSFSCCCSLNAGPNTQIPLAV